MYDLESLSNLFGEYLYLYRTNIILLSSHYNYLCSIANEEKHPAGRLFARQVYEKRQTL